MTRLVAFGLNHKSAPVDLRERLAVGEEDQTRVLHQLQADGSLSEVMLVSTCNRVEVYGVADDGTGGERILSQLAAACAVESHLLAGHVFVREAGDAARHIFRVAASLESMVVGEPQILGQVKQAYTRAKESGAVGPVLDRCMSLAFKSAKRVRTETEISRGAASVPSVAVDLAVSIFGDLSDSVVLIVGAGEMAEQAAIHLRAAGVPEVVVVNRSSERGLVLANKVSGRYEPWERLEAELARADVVVTSTGSKLPVISRPTVRSVVKARRRRPLFFVDIAVPRDVEPDVGKLDHVFLYNVDDLQGIVHDNLRLRRGEAERADALVEQEVHGFLQWMRSRSIGPLMGKLQSHGRTIVDQEVERTLARLGEVPDAHRAVVEQMGRSIMQKLLHRPMTNVRKAVGEVRDGFDGASLAEALSTLFDLTETEIVEEIEASSETASRARASGAKAISSAKGASSSNGASGAKGAERLPQETRATAPDPPSIPRAEPS